ncbi:MAG: DUF72 domain-containing protein [Chitinophagales bacterium]
MTIQNYYLGCPIWANKDWTGSFFTPKAKPKEYLSQYAKVFNTVEGNNTFYGLPKASMVMRWKMDTPQDFRFSFKFPKLISHVYKLQNVQKEVTHFFGSLEPLLEKTGIFFLQLPPSFNKKSLPSLEQFLQNLPQDLNYAVEVRHLDFFHNEKAKESLNDLLQKRGINRAIFDTSTLHAIESEDEHIIGAQRKKPQMPSYFTSTADQPFLRFVGYPTPEANRTKFTYLAQIVAKWLQAGKTPYVFIHSPGELTTPSIARFFHQLLQQECHGSGIEVGEVPTFPVDNLPKLPEQMSLF